MRHARLPTSLPPGPMHSGRTCDASGGGGGGARSRDAKVRVAPVCVTQLEEEIGVGAVSKRALLVEQG